MDNTAARPKAQPRLHLPRIKLLEDNWLLVGWLKQYIDGRCWATTFRILAINHLRPNQIIVSGQGKCRAQGETKECKRNFFHNRASRPNDEAQRRRDREASSATET